MVALSQSQKKTAFAVILLALIAVGVMVSGRGGFSGLQSDAFNNPSFVCTEASTESGEAKYAQAGTDIEKLTAEKTKLQSLIQKWSSEIRKNEAQVKKLEKEQLVVEKNVENLEKYIKNTCDKPLKVITVGGRQGGNASAKNNALHALTEKTCNQKKEELKNAKQDVKKVKTQLAEAKSAIAAIGHGSITNVQGQIPSLEQKIREAKNYREDYETCKRALEKPEVGIADFEIIMPGEVYINEPFDATVRALDASGKQLSTYEGEIFFDTNNNPADVVIPFEDGEYIFNLADGGSRTFEKGFILKKAGTYELVIFELDGPNGGIEKTILVVAKDKNTIPTSDYICTDSDGGINNDIKGIISQTYKGKLGSPVEDFCRQRCSNPRDRNTCIDTEAVVEHSCRPDGSGLIDFVDNKCPHGCSEGACKSAHVAACGNGIKEGTEQCDDGNTNNNDSCNNLCVVKTQTGRSCTDTDGGIFQDIRGTVSGIEINNQPYTYTDICYKNPDGKEWVSEAYCYAYPDAGGPKVFWTGEKRDCPYGCSDGACKPATVATCGNGIKEGIEQCDDGNANNNDSCDNGCFNSLCSILDICPETV